jgi:hypothetical protein
MEFQGKEQNTYKGIVLNCCLLIGFSLVIFLLMYLAFSKWTDHNKDEVIAMSMAFGFGIGTLFFMGCAIAGLFKGTFNVVVNRIKEFFSNLSVSFRFALRYYKENILEYGVLFWIYFSIFVFNVVMTYIGISNSIKLLIK